MFQRRCSECGKPTSHAANGLGVAICHACRERVRVVHPHNSIPVMGTVDSGTGRVAWDSEVKRIAAIAGRG